MPLCTFRSWRVGWVLVHDKKGAFAAIRDGLFKLSQLTLGANAIVQSALPAILAPEPGSEDAVALETFHTDTVAQLEENAAFTVERMSGVPGLRVVEPQGAMYVMIGIDTAAFKDIADDVDFTQKLLTEESVFMLPGQAFRMPMFARIVFSVSVPLESLGHGAIRRRRDVPCAQRLPLREAQPASALACSMLVHLRRLPRPSCPRRTTGSLSFASATQPELSSLSRCHWCRVAHSNGEVACVQAAA